MQPLAHCRILLLETFVESRRGGTPQDDSRLSFRQRAATLAAADLALRNNVRRSSGHVPNAYFEVAFAIVALEDCPFQRFYRSLQFLYVAHARILLEPALTACASRPHLQRACWTRIKLPTGTAPRGRDRATRD